MVSVSYPQLSPLFASILMLVGGKDLVVFLGLSGTCLGSLAVFVNTIFSSRRPLQFCGLFFAGVIGGLVTMFFFTVIIRMWLLGLRPALVARGLPCLWCG